MVIGICEMEIRIGYANSLKEKRRIVKSILGRVQSKYNVSIAEVDYQDIHKQTQIGLAYVSNDSAQAHRVLENVVSYIENNFDIELLNYHMEMI